MLRRYLITQSSDATEPRDLQLKRWINTIGQLGGCKLVPASEDASFRRYFRLQKGPQSFIAMDAPPVQEDSLSFVRVAGFLEAMQLCAPRILEADLSQGFLLLSDLGNEQYLARLRSDPESADKLYSDAIDTLLLMQSRGEAYQDQLPDYDETLLRYELSLFRECLCGEQLQLEFDGAAESQWRDCCDFLVGNATAQPQVFVHRDYHSRNLMLMPNNNPGILDFQDAVEGPLTYDLVSLLKDCYVRWPANKVRHWALLYYRSLHQKTRQQVDEQQFCRYFELMGVQRHLKAAGIFCRLNIRDGKPGYLDDVPRTLAYIVELDGRYEELEFLIRLIRDRILPVWETHK